MSPARGVLPNNKILVSPHSNGIPLKLQKIKQFNAKLNSKPNMMPLIIQANVVYIMVHHVVLFMKMSDLMVG